MIVLFTDFGVAGPYIGQMKAVLCHHAPNIPIIDLLSGVPKYNPRAAAYLLASYINEFPQNSVFLCVVDPGVGSDLRLPAVVRANHQWFVGPDNGLFNVIEKHSPSDVNKWCITWVPEKLSNSFHGRDLFAPIAAGIALGNQPPGDNFNLIEKQPNDWPEDLKECIYIDPFGNIVTGQRANRVYPDSVVLLNQHILQRKRTFSEASIGQAFWYENSNGLIEVAVNQGHAANQLGVKLGDVVRYRRINS